MKQVDLGDCRRTVELLPWYANTTLEAEERQYVKSHVDECASCRRELQVLVSVIEAMPSPRAAHDGAPPFSRLLDRINRQEQQARTWKMVAAVLVLVIAVAAVALPAYLFEPRYRAVTDALPETHDSVQLHVAFDASESAGTLTELLARYNADVISGPAADGSFLLEFHLAPGESAQQLEQRLQTEAQVRNAEPAAEPAQPQ